MALNMHRRLLYVKVAEIPRRVKRRAVGNGFSFRKFLPLRAICVKSNIFSCANLDDSLKGTLKSHCGLLLNVEGKINHRDKTERYKNVPRNLLCT